MTYTRITGRTFIFTQFSPQIICYIIVVLKVLWLTILKVCVAVQPKRYCQIWLWLKSAFRRYSLNFLNLIVMLTHLRKILNFPEPINKKLPNQSWSPLISWVLITMSVRILVVTWTRGDKSDCFKPSLNIQYTRINFINIEISQYVLVHQEVMKLTK